MNRLIAICLALALSLGLAACSTDRSSGELFAPAEVGTLVVDATLIVGDTLPPILLSRTLSPESPFTPVAAAVSGAAVAVRWDGGEALYGERAPGVYTAAVASPVAAGTTYRLDVRTARGEVLTAATTTPVGMPAVDWVLLDDDGTFRRRLSTYAEYGDSLYDRPENRLVYQQGLLEARFNRGEALAFQVGLSSLDEGSDFVIDPDFFDPEDFDDLERDVASPVVEAPDGRVRLPWFAIYFEGRYQVRVYSVDRNWYDLVRSLPELSGGGPGFGGQAGDDFERPLFHVDGGIGLFGSAAVDSIGFTIVPAP